jgi:lipoate-protein ligase A
VILNFLSQSLDAHWNLAAEDALLNRGEPCSFFWRATDSVVIGKNQNPWLECNLEAMATDGVPLARRISGGGAVFHDLGNLNYAFIESRQDYCPDHTYNRVIKVLQELGVNAERMGKSSIGVEGQKISGNAFAYRRNHVLHHGTLLLGADLDKLHRYLAPPELDMDTHAVRSEPAPVMNLKLDAESIIEAFGGGMPLPRIDVDEARFANREWVYGQTPKFVYQGAEIPKGQAFEL